MAIGNNNAHSSCLLNGNRNMVVSQAGTMPSIKLSRPTPSISLIEFRMYSESTVSSKCLQISGAGLKTEKTTTSSGSEINNASTNKTVALGDRPGKRRWPVVIAEAVVDIYLGISYFQPARSMSLTASALCCPNWSSLIGSAL